MSKLKLHIKAEELLVGKQFTFKAPTSCNPENIDSLLINNVDYELCDALGKSLCKKSNSWTPGALVSVILDTESKKAFILNSPKALGTTPADIGAATSGHTHALNSDKLTGKLPITKGGTDATNAPDARKNLGFITGQYTGNKGTQSITIPGASACNVIFIWSVGAGSRAFLTPAGGLGVGNGNTQGFSNNASGMNYSKSHFENGVIYLNCDHFTINGNSTYYYLCM